MFIAHVAMQRRRSGRSAMFSKRINEMSLLTEREELAD